MILLFYIFVLFIDYYNLINLCLNRNMKRHSKAEQQKEAIDTSEKLWVLLNMISKYFIPSFCLCLTLLQLLNVTLFFQNNNFMTSIVVTLSILLFSYISKLTHAIEIDVPSLHYDVTQLCNCKFWLSRNLTRLILSMSL